MLWVVDYTNPLQETVECIIVEADDYDSAYDEATKQLKGLQIPKRYIIRLEEF